MKETTNLASLEAKLHTSFTKSYLIPPQTHPSLITNITQNPLQKDKNSLKIKSISCTRKYYKLIGNFKTKFSCKNSPKITYDLMAHTKASFEEQRSPLFIESTSLIKWNIPTIIPLSQIIRRVIWISKSKLTYGYSLKIGNQT